MCPWPHLSPSPPVRPQAGGLSVHRTAHEEEGSTTTRAPLEAVGPSRARLPFVHAGENTVPPMNSTKPLEGVFQNRGLQGAQTGSPGGSHVPSQCPSAQASLAGWTLHCGRTLSRLQGQRLTRTPAPSTSSCQEQVLPSVLQPASPPPVGSRALGRKWRVAQIVPRHDFILQTPQQHPSSCSNYPFAARHPQPAPQPAGP